jgi:hypothetical protein
MISRPQYAQGRSGPDNQWSIDHPLIKDNGQKIGDNLNRPQ